MTIRLADIAFDHVRYDATADVLYLSLGEPREAADSLVTAEGHVVRYDAAGAIIGVTLVDAKWLTERDGELRVSLPISREQLEPAFA